MGENTVDQVKIPTDERRSTVAQARGKTGLGQIIGESPAFVSLMAHIPAVARYDVCALILGETGTGKEVIARAIHYCSARSAKPFIPVNCGAIPVDLLENEFFGHEPGAYTSATSCRRGLLKEADGGTLFLDEVDCLPALAQVKLLRFIQDGQFRPLGSERFCTADIRVIAASNADLSSVVESGRFRKDLYYRLNVVTLRLPPLRQREDDIVLLAKHFLAKYQEKFGAKPRELSSEALRQLMFHTWPGNVRELENVIQRTMVLTGDTVIRLCDIGSGDVGAQPEDLSFRKLKASAINQFEQSYLRRLLLVHEGNITRAAQSAGKDRRAFWELMRKHQISARQTAPTRL